LHFIKSVFGPTNLGMDSLDGESWSAQYKAYFYTHINFWRTMCFIKFQLADIFTHRAILHP